MIDGGSELSPRPGTSSSGRGSAYGLLGLYAVVLAFLSYHHEMFGDETQAWLIVRDSRSWIEMLGHLRYEGHPALWYLLLYVPAHLGASVLWLRGLNYILAIALAWAVLTTRKMDFTLRGLTVFGIFCCFYLGLLARSYTLTVLLLVVATRCLTSEKPRHWRGMVLLALAINSHFLAIPAAVGLFVWVYWLGPQASLQSARARLRDRRFWASVVLVLVALACCYWTVRPAPDRAIPEYDHPGNTIVDDAELALGRIWSCVTPIVPQMFTGALRQKFVPELLPAFPAAAITLIYWALIIISLPGRQSRRFFIFTSIVWLGAVLISIHAPSPHHASTLFAILVVSLMLPRPAGMDGPLVPAETARGLLVCFFGMMTLMAVEYCALEVAMPYSSAESTARWLDARHLLNRPMIFAPDHAGSVILAEKGIRSAYFATCRCTGSFVVFTSSRSEERQVSAEDVARVRATSGQSPLVLTHWQLPPVDLAQMHLALIYTSQRGFFWPYEDLYVYAAPQ